MQKIVGLAVLGLGLAFLTSEDGPSPAERDQQAADIARIIARANIIEPETVPAEQPGLRRPVTSPAATFISPPAATTAFKADTSPTDRALVAAGPASMTEALPVAPVPQPVTPAVEKSSLSVQRQLARQIQTELKRVGCYTGRIDGSWGDRSRTAMANFISGVNASLPTTEPDVFLLSLIKGQSQTVCGPTCSEPGGRCAAKSVIALNEDTDRETVQAAAEPPPTTAAIRDPLPGRMSVGGPAFDNASRPAPVTDWPSPAAERLPWQNQSQPPAPAPAAMAALEPADDTSIAVDTAPPAPRKITKSKRASAAAPKYQKRRYSSRSVQQLFMHPLGRM